MRRLKVLTVAFLAIAAIVLPLSASATTAAPAPEDEPIFLTPNPGQLDPAQRLVWPGECRHAFMWVRQTAAVYTEPRDTSQPFPQPLAGQQYFPCRALQLGARYAGCGGVNANGWILVPYFPSPPRQGWIKSTCTSDPDPLPPPLG